MKSWAKMAPPFRLSEKDVETLRKQLEPLLGLKLDWLSIPIRALVGFEPSQIAVIINTLFDAALPQLDVLGGTPANQARLAKVGLVKSPQGIGNREGYPDYLHNSGMRVELKGLFVDNPGLKLKRPPTKREPSARVKENVRLDNIEPGRDVLLIVAIRLEPEGDFARPEIRDLEVIPMIDIVEERDKSLRARGGIWVGKVPMVICKKSVQKWKKGAKLRRSDFEKDTNFGKLKRIPNKRLVRFLQKHGAGPLATD